MKHLIIIGLAASLAACASVSERATKRCQEYGTPTSQCIKEEARLIRETQQRAADRLSKLNERLKSQNQTCNTVCTGWSFHNGIKQCTNTTSQCY